ncbi:ABC transporter permease subunit [Saccharibacillus sp. CPCC 101409]|uniref:ABC transporter permease subunit n=1 Tax=Saccharibacillus sp. CPCC 101409 TaxID=3058041 RepID=UPI002671528B|nr:ABC transporter permease subunit [Saccharibacillus sp. CPCC 101409]MDO3411137.1 ABC transporter permease subunit [Saccharibacillus sp. CPCC 101409]
MNMYGHELKSLRKSALIWTCSMIALASLFLAVYPGMASDAAGFKQLLSGYPEPVREMLGIDLDTVASLLGFYSMVFAFVTLCGAIQGMNLGVSILSKESRERTADFLLVKPVSRSSIVTAKLAAACTALVATDLVFFAAVSVVASAVAAGGYSGKTFLLINLTLLFIQLIFLALGLAVSVFFARLKNVLSISLGTVFGFYVLGALLASDAGDEAARYLSPFKYFDSFRIIRDAGYEWSYMLAGILIVAAGIAVSYGGYIRKDIHAG